MSGRNDNAFERQLDREIDRLAGPEPRVDVREIVEAASGTRSRRRSFFFGGNLYVPAALVVVLVFGALIVVSGVLTPSEDATVGASPSPATTADEEPQEQQEPQATKVSYAEGTFAELDIDWDRLEPLMESGDFARPPEAAVDAQTGEQLEIWPTLYAVASSDSRLDGDAIVVETGDWLDHTVTVDDIDDPLPNGLWRLTTQYGRMEIRNPDGAWEGPVGPVFVAQGEDPPDGVPGNAPSLEGRTPAILSGSGAYKGLTAYVSFLDAAAGSGGDNLIGNGPFEAVIVNAAPVGEVPAGALADARAWVEAVRDAGLAE